MSLTAEEQRVFNLQVTLLKALDQLPLHEQIGIACALLFQAEQTQPEMVQRAMNEPIVRNGFRGESLIAALNRVCRHATSHSRVSLSPQKES